jgi:hypothetical protein
VIYLKRWQNILKDIFNKKSGMITISTKKRGQCANFEKKISALIHEYDESKLKCFMYFIDPSLTKNKNYYTTEITKIQSDYKIYAKLCYGKEFWDEIIHPETWNELLKYLEKYVQKL